MKKKILLSSIVGLFCVGIFQTQAQEIITNKNFPLEPYTATMVLINPIDYITPTEGPDQQWDYSSLSNQVASTPGLYEANHPSFPDAVIYKSYIPTFDVYEYLRDDYYEQNENGRYRVGSVFSNIGYSITDKTGGNLDSLWFGGLSSGFEGDPDLEVKFPLEYETEWATMYSSSSPFQLSVAAFGLDHALGELRQNVSISYDAVGYGTLVVPLMNGNASDPMNVILVKSTTSVVDSIYLNNAPAPPALMGAFGLTQGVADSFSTYSFYRPNYQDEVMILSPSSNTGIYRMDAASLAIPFVHSNKNEAISYPNPIESGETLHIETTAEVKHIRIHNLLGEVVYSKSLSAHQNTIRIIIPEGIAPGTYLYQLSDANDKSITTDILNVQ